ncbi:MAG: hypothetical protein IJ761_03065 [Bacteroidales bacterium]|nr:hypothetical protein [Bacteroidales bacterium]
MEKAHIAFYSRPLHVFLMASLLLLLPTSCLTNPTTEDADSVSIPNYTFQEEDAFDTMSYVNDTDSPHLTFKSVPIDGSLKRFVSLMQRVGFVYVDPKDGVAQLEGDFAGYKECKVQVSTLEGHDVVASITVQFPEQDQWGNLYADYKALKELLTEKYGAPTKVTELFQDYSNYGFDDSDRMFSVRTDRCKYQSDFKTEKGDIHLRIDHDGGSRAFVSLKYFDKLNSQTVRQQALNDL